MTCETKVENNYCLLQDLIYKESKTNRGMDDIFVLSKK